MVLRDHDFHPDEPTVRVFRTPPAGVLRFDDEVLVFAVRYGDRVLRHYAFADRWFKVNVTSDLDGRLVETGDLQFAFNCDVATPMERDGDAVYAVDLFTDVLVRTDNGLDVRRGQLVLTPRPPHRRQVPNPSRQPHLDGRPRHAALLQEPDGGVRTVERSLLLGVVLRHRGHNLRSHDVEQCVCLGDRLTADRDVQPLDRVAQIGQHGRTRTLVRSPTRAEPDFSPARHGATPSAMRSS